MPRFLALAFGTVSYLIFFGTFLYGIGFVANLPLPFTIDSGAAGPAGVAVAVNAALLVLFGLQHSVMARPGFKEVWTRFVPQPIERSTYVLFSSIALLALYAFWQPLPQSVWHVADPTLRAVFWSFLALGVGVILVSTFLIDHFDLFGLRQVVLYFRGRPYAEKRFQTPLLYRHIRHPLYVGWFLFCWATPDMTVGHALFAAAMTGYMLIAIVFEERDLADALGEPYQTWRAATPAFVPKLRSRGRTRTAAAQG